MDCTGTPNFTTYQSNRTSLCVKYQDNTYLECKNIMLIFTQNSRTDLGTLDDARVEYSRWEALRAANLGPRLLQPPQTKVIRKQNFVCLQINLQNDSMLIRYWKRLHTEKSSS